MKKLATDFRTLTFHNALWLVFILNFVVLNLGNAQSTPLPNSWRNQPENHDDRHVMIDGSTGRRVRGNSTFPSGSDITVYFVNLNPFKYNYEFTVDTRPLAQARIRDFLTNIPELSKIGGFDSIRSLTSTNLQNEADKKILEKIKEWQKSINALSGAIEEFRKSYDSFITLTNAEKIADDKLQATYNSAVKLKGQLENRSDTFAKWKKSATEFSELLNKIESEQKNNETILNLVQKLKTQSEGIESNVETLKSLEAKFTAMHKLLDRSLSSGATPFYTTRYIQNFNKSTETTTSIKRNDFRVPNSEDQLILGPRIRAGEESRITLSAGIALSFLSTDKIVRQHGKVTIKKTDMSGNLVDSLDVNGNPVIINQTVFGRSTSSDRQPVVISMLSATIFEIQEIPIKASIGIGIPIALDDATATSKLDYFLGASAGFADSHLMLSLLAHIGQTESLSKDSGYIPSDPVPADLADPLPITRSYKIGCSISLSFRMD